MQVFPRCLPSMEQMYQHRNLEYPVSILRPLTSISKSSTAITALLNSSPKISLPQFCEVTGSVIDSIVDLESLCKHVGQGCERRSRLADLMLRAIGVEFVSRPVLGSLSLVFRDVDENYKSTLFQQLRHVSDIITTSATSPRRSRTG